MKAIQAEGLSKTFDNGVIALSGLNLEVEQGEIFGFLGPNGAGKTTTVRLLNGILSPTAGRSTILGIPSADEAVRRQTATLAELARMYDSLTVFENLLFFARMYELPAGTAEQRIEEVLTRLRLWEKKDLKLGSFSTGMKQRVHLARALLHRPRVLFLDEPTSGLDPETSLQVTALIRRLALENGTTVFLCTHNLPQAEGICDSFGFIREGRLVAHGRKEEMLRSADETTRSADETTRSADETTRSASAVGKVEIRTLSGRHEFEFQDAVEIDDLVRRVQARGERITEVLQHRPSLQEVYFRHIGRSSNELE